MVDKIEPIEIKPTSSDAFVIANKLNELITAVDKIIEEVGDARTL